MSGWLSVPFMLLAFLNVPGRLLYELLAYAALGVMVFSQRATILKLERQLLKKKPSIVVYDRFDELVKLGDAMMKRFLEKKSPSPTREEFQRWDNELMAVAESCATINERNRLRDSSTLEIRKDDIVEMYLDVSKENSLIAQKLFVKLQVAREIMNRLRSDDSAS
jgi:hypothetical protein